VTHAADAARAQDTDHVLAFFLLTFAVTWACFITLASGAVAFPTPLGNALVLFGAYAPAMVAIAVTARTGGARGVRALLERIVPHGVRARWYVFAVAYILVIRLVVIVVHRLVTGGWPRTGPDPLWTMPFAIAISTPFQAGEELGWRGYALPRMAARLGFGGAALLLGLIWAVWHLPLFFVVGSDTYGQSFIVYALQVIAVSVAMGWLYAHTRGRLLPLMLMHAAINNTRSLAPGDLPGARDVFGLQASPVAWIGIGVMWLAAAWFLTDLARSRLLGPAGAREALAAMAPRG